MSSLRWADLDRAPMDVVEWLVTRMRHGRSESKRGSEVK